MVATKLASKTERMAAMVAGLPTKSAKIRKLGASGFSRAEIADFLDIRYQHVRNVLVEAARTGKAEGIGEPSKPAQFAVRIVIGRNGEVVVPPHILAAAGTGPGQSLLVRFDEDEIKLVTPEATTRKIHAEIRKYVPEGVSLADDLIAERRAEVAHEPRGA